MQFLLRLYVSTLVLVFACSLVGAQEPIDFNRDIRPILSDKCYFCHGPDEADRESGLRLDLRTQEAVDAIESGDLMDRIRSEDDDYVMPPPATKLSLTNSEKDLLQAWVDAGAQYEGHWAFERLSADIQPPEVKSDWPRQPIDHFVLKHLTGINQGPNGEAEPLRWLRRVTFDLTGLPPTPKEIHSFQRRLQQATPEQKEALYAATVDGILDSPNYGEHMAIAWLDAARYADSYGYQSDKLNTQWPYRDWVVRALNENLPYDQFITWQLAGDLLPNPSSDQKLATAFNRIHRLNNEGGAVFEEWRIENVADRVQTFGTAILGLTMECCRCHDHKYDPISMRDYYSLSAFFNSIDESGVYDRTAKVPCPSMLLPTAEQSAALLQAQAALRDVEEQYQHTLAKAATRFDAWAGSPAAGSPAAGSPAAGSPAAVAQLPDLRLALAFDSKFEDRFKEVFHPSKDDRNWTTPLETVPVVDSSIPRLIGPLHDAPKSASSEHTTTETTTDHATTDHASGTHDLPRQALKLDGERGITTRGIKPFDRWTPFTVVVSLRETIRVPQRAVIAHHTRGTDCGYNGWDLTIVNGHLESRMYRVWPGNAIGVRTKQAIPVDRWQQISASYDGSSRAQGLKLFLDGVELETSVLRDELKKSSNVLVDHGGEFVLGQRFRSRGFAGGLVDDLRIYTRNLSKSELVGLATGQPVTPSLDYFTSAIDEEARSAFEKLKTARKAVVMAEEAIVEIPIMKEMEQPRETHVLMRGQYDAKTSPETRVHRAVFESVLPPWEGHQPRNRLGLARWATDPDHPLTSRVIVNRLWSNFFGQGLVRTPENFGLQGELPTHPELLDWLARDFVDSGWDRKRFCKQVVLSATYRQDSAANAAEIRADPTNRHLGRGPAGRLTAEQIRDLALSASGLLNPQRGGPPVSPYQAGGDLWKESNGMSPPYQQSVGKDLYRRSLYSVWKRTAPLPNMLAFDAESREVCIVKRAKTNTPLQALVLMNDVQFVESARKLAERVTRNKSADSERIQEAFLRFAGRNPDAVEIGQLIELLNAERLFFKQHPAAAEQLLALGESVLEDASDTIELAALTTVCQTILNLDATIWNR